MAKFKGDLKVVIESDCMTTVKLINECSGRSSSTTIVRQNKEATKEFKIVRF